MIDEQDVETLARMAGLKIDPAYLPGVTNNLRTLIDQAALLMTPPIAPETEPATAYHA
jgi:hypothetical protein